MSEGDRSWVITAVILYPLIVCYRCNRILSHWLAYLILYQIWKVIRTKIISVVRIRIKRLREIIWLVAGHMTKNSKARAKPPEPVACTPYTLTHSRSPQYAHPGSWVSHGSWNCQELKSIPWEISPVWPVMIIWAMLMSWGLVSLMRLIDVLSSLAAC